MESPGDGRGVSPAEHSAIVTDVGGLDRVDQAVDSTEAPGWDTNGTFWRVDHDIILID